MLAFDLVAVFCFVDDTLLYNSLVRVLHVFWLKGGGGRCPPWLRQGGASRFFKTNNMIFLECGVIALIEAFHTLPYTIE